MRALVIQILVPAGIRECDVAFDELMEADEVFVTNALLGIKPGARIDGTAYDMSGNLVTRRLMAAPL